MRFLTTRLLLATLALAIAGCGGKTSPGDVGMPAARTVHGAVVKGPLVGATVSFFHIDAAGNPVGPAVATAVTDALGHVSAELPQLNEPLLAISSGGSYVDESDDAGGENRRRITLAPGQGFEAIVPANADTFVLTPYSMALLLRAWRLAGNGNFMAVYEVLRQQAVAVLGFDPTSVIPGDPLAPDLDGDPQAVRYALALGGAAYAMNAIAAGLGVVPNYGIVRAFIDDLSDGALDGRVDDALIVLKLAPINDVDLNGEIVRFRNNHFELYDGVLVEIDEASWSITPSLPPDPPPMAVADAITVAEGGTATTLAGGATSVLANDGGNASLVAMLVTEPIHGELTLNPDGTFHYVHDGSQTTTDVFTYRATDGAQDSAPVSVSIAITPVNDLPVANDDGYTGDAGDVLTVSLPGVLFNDVDADGDALTAVLVTPPTHGTLVLDANGGFRYTPSADFDGADFFTYRASDGQGVSNLATVQLRLTGTNAAPIALDDSYQANGGPLGVLAPGVLGNDSDPDGDSLSAILVTPPAVGTLALVSNGSFSYSPPPGFNGTVTFQYRASDGQSSSNVATVQINVRSVPDVNHAPIGKDDAYSTTFGDTLVVPAPGVLGNDSDPDGDALSAVLVSGPSIGSLDLHPDGSFEYPAFSDKALRPTNPTQDQFTYRASDGELQSALVTVTITINQAPSGAADDYNAIPGEVLAVDAPGVLDNDFDGDGDAITAVLETAPTKGTLNFNADGSFMYQPFAGTTDDTDQFTYRIDDGLVQSDPVTVTIDTFFCDCSTPQGRHSAVLTQDGSTVVFLSADQSLDPAKTTTNTDIFVTTFNPIVTAGKSAHAKVSVDGGTTLRLMAANGAEPNSDATRVNVTPDGHYVVFTTYATNYVTGLTLPGFSNQVYRYSLSGADAGEIVLVSAQDDSSSAGNGFDNQSDTISDDGNFVAFQSSSTNIASPATSGEQVFRRDISNEVTTLVSAAQFGGGADSSASTSVSSISADGDLVSFESNALNILPNNAKAFSNGSSQTYVRDVGAGTTVMASVDSQDNPGDNNSVRSWLSPDGSLIAIQTYARNLITGDTTAAGLSEVIVHDLSDLSNVRVSEGVAAAAADGSSQIHVNAFSADNQFVSFVSQASNLVANDTNEVQDVFVHSLVSGTTARVNLDAEGDEAVSGSRNQSHALSADGSKIAFDSNAINLEDPTGQQQVYVVDNPLDVPVP